MYHSKLSSQKSIQTRLSLSSNFILEVEIEYIFFDLTHYSPGLGLNPLHV